MEKSELLELYYQLKDEYTNVIQKIAEYQLLKDNLNELKKQENTYIHFGGSIFVKGKILDDERLLVNIGDNIFVEKTKEEVIKILEDTIKELEKIKVELEKEIDNIKSKLQP